MSGSPSDLLGRDRERDRLVAAIEADRSVAVVGEAGIGKTSLVRAAVAATDRRLLEGGGFATLRHSPALALRRALDVPILGDDAAIAASVERRVGPDVLFIDDLHWADRTTARVLRLLRGRVTIVVAIRTGDPGTDEAVTLAEELRLEVLGLSGIETDAARSIVLRSYPDLRPTDAERVVARAGGNPLMLEEMAAHGKPSTVLLRSITSGFERLSKGGRAAVELVAMIDRPVDRRLLGDAIAEPLRIGVVVERSGQVEIRHALVAEAIRAGLDDARRRTIHEEIATVVVEASEVARHLLLAGLPAQAAAVASARLATTHDLVTRARLLEIIAEATGPEGGLTPRLEAGAALSAIAEWESVERVLGRVDGPGTADERAERDALLAHSTFELGRHAESRAFLDRADAHALEPGSPAAAHVAIERAAFMVNVGGELMPAIAHLERELMDHPPDHRSHHTVRAILESMRLFAAKPVDIEYLRAAVDGAMAARQYASAADLARVVTFALLIWEGAQPALAFVEAIGSRLDAAGVPGAALDCRAEAVQANVLAGRPADAVARADDVLEQPAPPRARQTATIFRARALGLMGLLDEASRTLGDLEATVTSDFVGLGELTSTQADLALWGGRTDRALALVEAVLRIPSPIFGAYTLPQTTRAWAQFDAGLPPEPAMGILAAPTQAGAPFEMEGLRLLHAGDPATAAAQFHAAAMGWSGFNVPRELFCRWAEGESLRRASQEQRMIECLEATLETAIACRIEAVAVRVRRSLRQAGRRVAAADPQPRITRLGITHRERQLLDLAGQGLTNTEIARRMGLGRPTVARILSNAMVKLGATSRGQAVRLLADDR